MEQHTSTIQINFALVAGQDGDLSESQGDSPATIKWFKEHGYTLYERIADSETIRPVHSAKINSTQGNYPYAFYDLGGPDMSEEPESKQDNGKIAFAQDSASRHVAIKIVRTETDEYRILHFLSQQRPEILKENCVIPVFDMLPIEGFYFVVMPRWGRRAILPPLCYTYEAINMIHSLLKGLSYLHENNIAHHDIAIHNILVNHFVCDKISHTESFYRNQTRGDLRSRNCLLYALFDFDCSFMLPSGADRRTFRLPYYESFGSFNVVKDTDAGEFEYNPLVFDVGIMGVLICRYFQRISPDLPMLAPLLDRMTTWDLDRRFTASEALQFFEDRKAELSDDQLQKVLPQLKPGLRYDTYDRWKGLPPDFIERWKTYRTPPLPWHIHFLRRIRDLPHFYYILPRTRLFFYRLFTLPRRLYNWIIPSSITI